MKKLLTLQEVAELTASSVSFWRKQVPSLAFQRSSWDASCALIPTTSRVWSKRAELGPEPR